MNRSSIQIILGLAMVVLALGSMIYQWLFTPQVTWSLLIGVFCGAGLAISEFKSRSENSLH